MAKKRSTSRTQAQQASPERRKPQSAAAPHPPERATTPLPPGVRLVQVLRAHTNIVRQVAWMPDGKYLVSASTDDRLILWNVVSGKHRVLHSEAARLYAVAVTPDGRRVVFGGRSERLNIHDLVSGETRHQPS